MQALQQLFCARRILGNTYVSAFYFFGNDMFQDEITPEQNEMNKSLFEDQQACLEIEVGMEACIAVHSMSLIIGHSVCWSMPDSNVMSSIQTITCITLHHWPDVFAAFRV